jgi:hypothetical protein
MADGPIRWRQEDSLRRWDNTIRLHGGSLQSRAFFIVLNLKTSNFTQIRSLGLNHQIFQKLWHRLQGWKQSRDWTLVLLKLLCLQERLFWVLVDIIWVDPNFSDKVHVP